MVGGFATAYDLVSSSYGWSDKQIGDLPLGRFRQITAAIQLRHWQERREESSRISWQTRILAQYTAAGYMIEKGKPNSALENSTTLGYDDIERALQETPVEAPKPKENTPGSFERLMGFSGGMQRRS